MSVKPVIQRLDALLKPLGFTREKDTWNRRENEYVDVVDVQISKAGDSITVNAGVLDTRVHDLLWNQSTPFLNEPACTIGLRIGELMGGKDRWWDLGEEAASEAVVASVESHVLPFLTSMHSREAMEQWLHDAGVTGRRHPPPILALAILMHLSGKSAEACALLSDLRDRTSAAWRERTSEVAARLGCR
jgi:hypothetical protein